MAEPKKRGIWVRGKVEKVSRQAVVCTLYVGVDLTPVPGCKLPFPDETMKLEVPVKPANRSKEMELEINTAVEWKNPPKCEVCQDNERKKCKECGCSKCGGKNDANSILIVTDVSVASSSSVSASRLFPRRRTGIIIITIIII